MTDRWTLHADRLSTKPQVFEGRLEPGELPRLAEAVEARGGELRYTIRARLDAQRRRVVSCIIEGFVFLTCQSTLETFRHPVSIEERLVLVDREAELPPIEEESETEDYLVADAPLDIRDLIVDAVILALPMVPRKPGLEATGGEGREAGAKPSPFAKLASLKRSK